jgi:AcrR family transcriptional regulator
MLLEKVSPHSGRPDERRQQGRYREVGAPDRYDHPVTDNEPAVTQPVRIRDPERAGKILEAAAELFAARGFHSVSLSDIGRSAGIVGSGIYRHFESKYAVLVALLERSMSALLESAELIVERNADSADTMKLLVRNQIDFCIDHGVSVQLYRNEINTLSTDDARRLRRMQRRYVEEWVSTLLELRPDVDEASARAIVHASIGAIQSIVSYDSGLTRTAQIDSLTAMATACLSAQW